MWQKRNKMLGDEIKLNEVMWQDRNRFSYVTADKNDLVMWQ